MKPTQKIEKLKAWCLANYNKGADTMVECWDDSDYELLLNDNNDSYTKSLKTLKTLAEVYAERQADAKSYEEY